MPTSVATGTDRQPWRLGARGRWWLDLALVAFLLVLGGLGHLLSGQYASSLFTVAEAVPLLWRRRHAWPSFLAVAGASALQAVVVGEPTVGQLAFPVAVYSVVRWSPRWQGFTALGVAYCAAVVASSRWILGFGGDLSPANLIPYVITIGAIVTAAFALGFAAQEREKYVSSLVARAEQAERMAEREVELAARDERSRIAREMHDVVAHGLSVIVVQADGARYAAAKDPAVAVGTLETISATGREALTEMRRLLGLLRDGDTGVAPQPGLADVRHLVDEARAAGTRVEASLPEPVPDVPDGVGLAAYRIVQESLTNVRKHAGPDAQVSVRVRVGREVEVEVRDDGRGAAALSDGRGLGLAGMRERAAVHGGSLEAGPVTGGGFAVSARLPL